MIDPDTEPTVLVAEVAARLGGRDPSQLAATLNGATSRDWAGRPCMSASAARALVERYDEDVRRRDELNMQWEAYLAGVEAARQQAFAEAYGEAERKARAHKSKAMRSSGYVDANASEILSPEEKNDVRDRAQAALGRWMSKHPSVDRGTFEQDPDKHMRGLP